MSHIPVMLKDVVNLLNPRNGMSYIDATFGYGGHTRSILQSANCSVEGIDQDPQAIARGKEMEKEFKGRLIVHQGKFSEVNKLIAKESYDGILLDIGVSSFQIKESSRGFSFQNKGPLDMRMSQKGIKASDVVNLKKKINYLILSIIMEKKKNLD